LGKLNDQIMEAVAEMKVTGTHECRTYDVHDCILQAVVDTPELAEMEPNDAWLVAMLGLHNFCTTYDEKLERHTIHQVSCPDAIKSAATLGYAFTITPCTPEHLESIKKEQRIQPDAPDVKWDDSELIDKAKELLPGICRDDNLLGVVQVDDETQEEDAENGSDLGDQGDDQPSDER